MLIRKDLLIATALTVVLHACFVLLSVGESGVSLPMQTPSSGAQDKQAWILSEVKTTTSTHQPPAEDISTSEAESVAQRNADTQDAPGARKSSPEKVLASTFTGGVSNADFLALEDTDTPAVPAANWILPLKKGYLDQIRSLVVRVWIQQSGLIAGVELLDVNPPALLDEGQMREVVEWLANTPMNPATKNGAPVANKRTLEIAFEH